MIYREPGRRVLCLGDAPGAGLALRRRAVLVWRRIVRRIDWLWRNREIEAYLAANQREIERMAEAHKLDESRRKWGEFIRPPSTEPPGKGRDVTM